MSLAVAAKPQLKPAVQGQKKDYSLIILGGGPAGLAAAIYALRAKLDVLLVEKMVLGGQASTTYHIDNYPGFPDGISGLDLAVKMSEQAEKLGLKFDWGNVDKIVHHKNRFEVHLPGKTLTCQALIFAAGAEPLKLNVPGEEEFRGRGVSYCATCDGPFYQDKNIMVIGGGNSAVEEALFLTRFAKKVGIVHRRDTLRADKLVADQAKNHPKIYFFWNSVLEKIVGSKNVESVVLREVKTNNTSSVPAEGVFVYIGTKPNSELIKPLVKQDDRGFIMTDEKMATATPGLFVAGDCRVKALRQVVTAVADGAIAAQSAREYLEGLTSQG
ncbi:thioredoxin-disulfide reductase [candidate division WOR-1 bacterium RIFOXYB2_FULL_48_7]|uniref:Thioredoxin reductase n=1 Tax=candidate division WOR-1 bacterium RIFOXYB2_FULL_48_7 TaxID=1802583 RepID=A0A1F4TUE7_UNCSA|nr:MAG: thioredoxin-disulfide reductase [candidate division WOR-1 bacterium RIFOXYB2_FULL_48_7]